MQRKMEEFLMRKEKIINKESNKELDIQKRNSKSQIEDNQRNLLQMNKNCNNQNHNSSNRGSSQQDRYKRKKL